MLAFQNVLVYLLYEYTSICIIIIIFINIQYVQFYLIELKGPGKNKIRKKYRLLSGKDGGFTYRTVR